MTVLAVVVALTAAASVGYLVGRRAAREDRLGKNGRGEPRWDSKQSA